jgi:hypothetical protein
MSVDILGYHHKTWRQILLANTGHIFPDIIKQNEMVKIIW